MSFEACEEKIGKPVGPFAPPGKYNFNPFEKDAIEITDASTMEDLLTAITWWDLFGFLDHLKNCRVRIPRQ